MGAMPHRAYRPPPQDPMLPMHVKGLLSPREEEVLGWLGRGMKFDQIANRLHISPHTMRGYVKTIYNKAGVHSVRELIMQQRVDESRDAGMKAGLRLVQLAGHLLEAETEQEMAIRLKQAVIACAGAESARYFRLEKKQPPAPSTLIAYPSGPRYGNISGPQMRAWCKESHRQYAPEECRAAPLKRLGISGHVLVLRLPAPEGMGFIVAESGRDFKMDEVMAARSLCVQAEIRLRLRFAAGACDA